MKTNKFPRFHFTTIIFSYLLVFCCFFLLQSTVGSEEITVQKQKLHSIKGKIAELSIGLKNDKKTRTELIAVLAKIEKELGELSRTVHQLQVEIKQLDDQLQALINKIRVQEQRLNHLRVELRSQVVTAYAMGRQERLKLMLNQQDPALMSRIMTYFDYFNRERVNQIENTKQLIAKIHRTESKITAAKSQLKHRHFEKNKKINEIFSTKKTRARLVGQLDREIKNKAEALKRLKEDAQALSELLVEIQRKKAFKKKHKQQKFTAVKGHLPWPTKGYLSVFFGAAKEGGVTWDGVFIKAKEGSEVKAIHHGRVAYADWLRGYGLLMIIDHGEGIMTLYGHNQSLFKEVGDRVNSGESIALIGNSGGHKTMGLYFSIRKNGKPSNPKKWCKKMKGRQL